MKLIMKRKGLKAVMVLAALIVFAGLGSCYRDKADQVYPGTNTGGATCDTTTVTYSGTIKPIVEQHCAITGCHDGATYSSAYPMTSRDQIYNYCVATNKLLGSIRHESGFVAMPQGAAKLDDCSINKITRWVNQGAPNN